MGLKPKGNPYLNEGWQEPPLYHVVPVRGHYTISLRMFKIGFLIWYLASDAVGMFRHTNLYRGSEVASYCAIRDRLVPALI